MVLDPEILGAISSKDSPPVYIDQSSGFPGVHVRVYVRVLGKWEGGPFLLEENFMALVSNKVYIKFLPRLLTDAQKENRVTFSQELFDRSNADENILKNVIIGDETWVYGYNVETKVQSSQWIEKLSP